jgi:hypothetical protein
MTLRKQQYEVLAHKNLNPESTDKLIRECHRFCFSEVMGFLKMSTSLNTRLAAEKQKFLYVTENREEFLNYEELLEYQ